MLDVIFKEDLSRLRRGHGARNMALVRRFAFNLLRRGKGKNSVKTARKIAGWRLECRHRILTSAACQPGLVAVGSPGQRDPRFAIAGGLLAGRCFPAIQTCWTMNRCLGTDTDARLQSNSLC